MKLFVAAPLPEATRNHLRQVVREYDGYIEELEPEKNWHLKFWLGREDKNLKQIAKQLPENWPQKFAPAILITHLGKGQRTDQLWAYVQPTGVVQNIHRQLRGRLTSNGRRNQFVPHIKLATLEKSASKLLTDTPLQCSFMMAELNLFSCLNSKTGVDYKTEKKIRLTP